VGFTVIADATLYVTLPGIAWHTGPIAVCSPGGCADSLGLGAQGIVVNSGKNAMNTGTVQPPPSLPAVIGPDERPAISSFKPARAPRGARVVVYGSRFRGVAAVEIAGVSAVFRVIAGDRIGFVVPGSVKPGIRMVRVKGSDGLSAEEPLLVVAAAAGKTARK
jgi:hypothetical protein